MSNRWMKNNSVINLLTKNFNMSPPISRSNRIIWHNNRSAAWFSSDEIADFLLKSGFCCFNNTWVHTLSLCWFLSAQLSVRYCCIDLMKWMQFHSDFRQVFFLCYEWINKAVFSQHKRKEERNFFISFKIAKNFRFKLNVSLHHIDGNFLVSSLTL